MIFLRQMTMILTLMANTNAWALIGADDSLYDELAKSKQVALFQNKELLCGSTIIAENILITAAHCLKDNQNKNISYSYKGREIDLILNSKNIEFHKTLDLALIKLSEKFFTDEQDFAFLAKNKPNQMLVVGFGCQSLFQYGQEWILGTNGILKGAYLKNINSNSIYYEWYSKIQDGTIPALCPGDSGSGLFIKNSKGQLTLIAVNSHIGLESALEDGISRATRIDLLETQIWIQNYILKNKNNL